MSSGRCQTGPSLEACFISALMGLSPDTLGVAVSESPGGGWQRATGYGRLPLPSAPIEQAEPDREGESLKVKRATEGNLNLP